MAAAHAEIAAGTAVEGDDRLHTDPQIAAHPDPAIPAVCDRAIYRQLCAADAAAFVAHRFGIRPGLLSGHFAISDSSTLRCCATSFGGVWVSQLDKENSS